MAMRIRNNAAFNDLVIWTSTNPNDVATSPTLSSGSGAPSASEVDGSLYLRTNGSLYQRVSSAWVLIGSTSDFGSGGILTDTISESTAGAGVSIAMPDNDSAGFVLKEGANQYIVGVTTNSGEKIQFLKTLDIDAASIDIATQATSISLKDNEAAALDIKEGANSYIKCVTTDGAESIAFGRKLDLSSQSAAQVLLQDNQGAALSFKEGANDYVVFVTTNSAEAVNVSKNLNASAGIDIPADSQALTVGASADLSISHNGTNSLITNNTGILRIDNTNATGKVQIDLGSDNSNTAFEVRDNSGNVLISVDASGAKTGLGDTIYNQTLELVRMRAFGSTNTNVLRTAAADQKATGASCFTSTDSATLGRYITASRAIMMTVSVCLNVTGGSQVIRAGAALDNSVAPDSLEKCRGLGLAGASPVRMTSTFHMASGDVCWVASDATPNNPSDYENLVIFSARSV